MLYSVILKYVDFVLRCQLTSDTNTGFQLITHLMILVSPEPFSVTVPTNSAKTGSTQSTQKIFYPQAGALILQAHLGFMGFITCSWD